MFYYAQTIYDIENAEISWGISEIRDNSIEIRKTSLSCESSDQLAAAL
jgi:hypothetical protein